MRKILIIFVLLVAFTGIYAQQQVSVIPDNKLYSRFLSEEINRMVTLMPQEITYWNWFAYNGFVVKRTTPEAAQKFPPLKFYDKETKLAGEEEVGYIEEGFNIMAYDFEIHPDKTTVYRIGNTGYVVNIYSSRNLVELYNKFMSHE